MENVRNHREDAKVVKSLFMQLYHSGKRRNRRSVQHSTNFPLTGDALEVAKKHHIRLEHLDYVQVHPTTLYSEKPGRRFLTRIRPVGKAHFSIIKTWSVS